MKRDYYLQAIENQFDVHPVVGLLGPRQAGKTTLAKMFIKSRKKVEFYDLENPLDLGKLEQPMLTLSRHSDCLIVIDEVQKKPDLFPILRVLADETDKNREFLILGSASRDLIRQSSETLAGRIGYVELPPFSLFETQESKTLWLRGGFPRSYLAGNESDSFLWRQSYISTFLERDIPNLGFHIPPEQIRRFWMMLAHYHGQIFNASEIGQSLGVSDHTVRRYLDILVGTFMVRLLPPWFENVGKRQVKSPKIYFRDSGVLNALLGLRDEVQLHNFPKLGSFWEGFAVEQIILQFHAASEECYFWKIQSGAELDLLLIKDGKRLGFEFKYSDRPALTSSMKTAFHDLKLDHLYCIYPGEDEFPLSEQITAHGLNFLFY